jgi:hypothetical protein
MAMDMKMLLESFEKYVEDEKKHKENYQEGRKYEGGGKSEMMAMYLLSQFLQWLTFLIAFYLSWQCNSRSRPEMDEIEKGVRGFFAGIFGFFYIVVYLLFWSDDCYVKRRI